MYDKIFQRYSKIKALRTITAGITLRIVLLYLAIDDAIGADRTVDQYRLQEGANEDAREIRLAIALINLYTEKDISEVENVTYNYRKVTPFDPINQKLYEKMKKNLEKAVQNNYFDENSLA